MSPLLFALISFFSIHQAHAVYFPTTETVFDLSDDQSISGNFTYTNKGLVVYNEGILTSSYFMPTTSRYVNGTVRTIVDLGDSPDMSINFRCQNIRSPYSCFSTYRIKISTDGLYFQTKRQGVIVAEIPIEVTSNQKDHIEIVVSSFMEQHYIFIYNVLTGEQIGSLFVQDAEWVSGFAGVEASSQQGSNTIVSVFGIDVSEQYSLAKTNFNLFKRTQIQFNSPKDQKGEWSFEHGLTFNKNDPDARYNVWMSSIPAYSNGTLKTKIRLGTKPDTSVLFRYDPNSSDNPSGYSISIEGKNLRVYRWDSGKPRTIKRLAALPKETSEVYIIVSSINHTHSLSIIDAQTQITIDTYQFTDSRWLKGSVAFRAHKTQDSNTKITQATVLASPYDQTGTVEQFDIFGQEGRAIVNDISKSKLRSIPHVQWIQTTKRGEHIVFTNRDAPKLILNRGGTFSELNWKIPYTFKNVEYIDAQREIANNTFDVLETTSYKTPEMVEQYLRLLHQQYPTITKLEVLTHSRNNRPIYALRITDNPTVDENEPMILLNGAHHGSELMTTEFALDAAKYLLQGYSTDEGKQYVNNLDVWVVPLVNPDGNDTLWNGDHNTGRKNHWDVNGNGIIDYNEGTDLNRNYPFAWHTLEERGSSSFSNHSWYRGHKPASEPETQAMMALANKYHPAVVFSWHTSGNMIISPYTIDNIPIPDPDIPWIIAEELIKDLPKAPGKRKSMRLRRNMYSVDGTDQDWHYYQNGSIAYIIEGPLHNPKPELMKASIEYLRLIFNRMLKYVDYGPRVYGQILDDQGNPIEATIQFKELQTFLDENWMSRDFDGRYDRFTGENGRFTIIVSAPGFETQTKTIVVNGPTNLNITLQQIQP